MDYREREYTYDLRTADRDHFTDDLSAIPVGDDLLAAVKDRGVFQVVREQDGYRYRRAWAELGENPWQHVSNAGELLDDLEA